MFPVLMMINRVKLRNYMKEEIMENGDFFESGGVSRESGVGSGTG